MARYNRINIDGKLITETRLLAEEAVAGTVVAINDDNKFEKAADATGRVYVVGVAYSQGQNIDDVIPADSSVQADYVESGRELVVRVAEGEYKKDDALVVADGLFAAGDDAVAFAQEDHTATAEDNLLRIRIK